MYYVILMGVRDLRSEGEQEIKCGEKKRKVAATVKILRTISISRFKS